MPKAIKILVVLAFAIFFSLVCIDNIIDFNTNWQFVQHVLAMDTTFKSPNLMSRAINDSNVQQITYYLIIAAEGITAITLWAGIGLMLNHRHYTKGKLVSMCGITIGLTLYFIGFIDIGSEWFAMWQSSHWRDNNKAGTFSIMLMLALIILSIQETS